MPMPRTMCTPFVAVGTMIWVIFPGAPSSPDGSLARHITMKKSASIPFDVNHLWPLMTQSSPSRTASVSMERGSDPAWSGSVMENPDCSSPSIRGSSHFRFCSSVPYFTSTLALPELGAAMPNRAAAPTAYERISYM